MLLLTSYHADPDDYSGFDAFIVTFVPDGMTNRMQCVNITASTDSVLENTEVFRVNIGTSDSAVLIQQNNATVSIIDNTCKYP